MFARTERRPSGACPTFFRARCRESSRGGSAGYAEAGYSLVGAVAGLLDVEGDELDALLAELEAAIWPKPEGRYGPPDDAAVLAWFDRELPRCMALVPRARRGSFLRGVYRYARDEEQDVTSY